MSSPKGIASLNPLHELDALNWAWTPSAGGEVKIRCPVHDDTTPSASMNSSTGAWKCHVPSCNASGDLVAMIAYATKVDRRVALAELQRRHPELAGVADLPMQTVEKFHAKIWDAGPLLDELRKRGVTDDMIREARLGFWEGRITIPVFDDQGRCVNIRRYLPGAPGPQKMRNTTGYGGPHVYRVRDLIDHESVWVCGGEMKALVAGTVMRGSMVGACCSTGGEGHWDPRWLPLLDGKRVWICMDVDAHGIAAARRLATMFHGRAAEVRIVRLPLDTGAFPKGDVNDWVGTLGAKAADFSAVMVDSPVWSPPSSNGSVDVSKPPERMLLTDAAKNSSVGRLVEVSATVVALDQTPYLVPKDLDVECTRDQPGCDSCPIKSMERDQDTGFTRATVAASSPGILGIIGAPEREQRDRVREAVCIPTCKAVRFYVRSRHVVYDARLTPPIDLTGKSSADFWLPAMIVAPDVTLNVPYRLIGATHPSPKSQQCALLVHSAQEAEDTLDTFEPAEHELAELRAFQPSEWTIDALSAKVRSLCEDLEANVTRIWQRPAMHVTMDLAWHAPLFVPFEGRAINGWVNALVIGDSSQGKSECALRLMQHYGCGERLDCKNATVAGLLGGLEQMGTRWFVKWGAIPQHDRRLLILEELKGASVDVLAKLTDMRSSGVAEIPKIERRRTHARTRMIMISNARSPRPMSSFNFGVEAVLELLGSLEDVRRLDVIAVAAKGEVDDHITNVRSSDRPHRPHVHTSELCKRLVLWSWSRSGSQVLVEQDAEIAALVGARALCDEFSESIPIIDRGTTKQKLIRLAAALAARTFSTDNGATLIVRPCHVEWITEWIRASYSAPAVGYADFSKAARLMTTVRDPHEIRKAITGTRHPLDFVHLLLQRDTVSLIDIQSACGIDEDDARQLLSLFVRKGALLRTHRIEHAKNPEFIELLKSMRDERVVQDTTDQEY